jgi:hypothetical protein
VTEIVEVPKSSSVVSSVAGFTEGTGFITGNTNSKRRSETSIVTTTDVKGNTLTNATPLTTLYITSYTDTDGETESGMVSCYTSTESQGSTITLTTTECFCTKVKTAEYVTTVTNTNGGVETLTVTVACVTNAYTDANGKTKIEIVTGVVTTDSEGSVVVFSATSEVKVTTVTRINGAIETVRITVVSTLSIAYKRASTSNVVAVQSRTPIPLQLH